MKWIASYEEGERVAFRIGREGDELVAEWPEMLMLRAQRDGSRHSYVASHGADPSAVEKIQRGIGRALLRHLSGDLSLHGGAVAWDGLAVVLLGRSGQGKSTMTAALCLRGHGALYSDDIVPIENVGGRTWITPLDTEHWLDEGARAALGLASGAGKIPVPTPIRGEGLAELRLFVDLAFGDVRAPVVTKLTLLEAVAQLVPQVARFVLDEPEVHRRELDELAKLVKDVPMVRITRPRSYDGLDRMVEQVVALLQEHPT